MRIRLTLDDGTEITHDIAKATVLFDGDEKPGQLWGRKTGTGDDKPGQLWVTVYRRGGF